MNKSLKRSEQSSQHGFFKYSSRYMIILKLHNIIIEY